MKPLLGQLRSIKTKLSIVIIAAVFITAASGLVGVRVFRLSPYVCALLAAVIALICVQILARGMTKPLRQMAAAAKAMAEGDHEQRVLVTTRDELGKLAAAFNAMAQQIGETERLRRDLVANVSHDLRTPVAALQVTLENLVDGVQQIDQKTVEGMLAQIKRLGGLVEQLLDLSRLESSSVEFRPEPVIVEKVLMSVAAQAKLIAPEKKLQIRCTVQPEGLETSGEATRIHQLVANLVENAVRFSPSAGKINIEGREQGDHVLIAVADEGPGIAQSEIPHIFERFYRVDHARTSGSGAGLGLSIVKWIVDLHHGTVYVEQEEPNGTRFVVLLPKVTER